jgi:ATP-dependent Clp protease ATP-binding subunit ClpX
MLHMFKKKTLPVLCSFCGKTADEARRLVGGPGVHICADCATACCKMLAGEPAASGDAQKHSRLLRLYVPEANG